MDKKQLLIYAALSLGLVIAGALLAKSAFAWFEHYLFGRKKPEPTLDELIDQEELLLRGGRPKPSGRAMAPRDFKTAGTEEAKPMLEDTTDPAELEKRKIMKRAYLFDPQRLPTEPERTYYLRILGLKPEASVDAIKSAYRARSKDMHPDRFQLNAFDPKTKKRLEKRVHENYVLIQKAHDFLRKK